MTVGESSSGEFLRQTRGCIVVYADLHQKR